MPVQYERIARPKGTPKNCVENAVSKAVESGLADYDAYIALQRQNFMTSYINTCSLAKANANMVGVQQEYHYTLYYYDQADNLARTIPPEGVTLVNPNLFSYIDHVRDVDTATVSYSYNGPETASSLPAALTTLSATLSATTGAVEMWLYNASLNHYHWVEVTPDQKYLFQLGIAGSTLNIDVYPLKSPNATTVQLMPTTGHYQADISAALPLYPFTHVVFQGSSLGSGTTLPQIYLNGQALTVSTSGTPGPFGFTIKVGSSVIIYPDSNQSLKHMRLYNHLLSPATIAADAANNYFSATDLSYTGWYRFNIPAPGTPPTTVNGTSDETTNVDLYPGHVLPTSYTYNATNQVTTQQSPDGGTNRFWYDLLSRLVISQNDKQLAANNYSYTQYDSIGRITEVGQKNYMGSTLGSPDYLSNATITAFNTAGANSQITDTYYDNPVPTVSGNTNGIATLPGQSNLRKRVAASTYTETQGSPVLRATYYNYDIDGNVKTLWQQVDGIYQNSTNTGLKRIDYEYDLVSGKVNFVRYQDGQPDAFYYQYNYDADNRLTKAWSSTTAMVDTTTGSYLPKTTAKQDAAYYYYLHGPLRRMELGDSTTKVQGVDYAYTLQGWLKGVNSTSGTAALDMGQDGATVARDAYGYSLGYYTNDYNPIGGSGYAAFALKYTAATGDITGQSLYNGNISNATLAINQLGTTVGYTYHYDQLNRLKKMRQHTGISGTSWDRSSITLNYQENAMYDGNGNILTYGRNGAAPTAQTIDSLTYNYPKTSGRLSSNRLQNINDAIANSNYTGDLTNQTNATNYRYDAIGNLIYDAQSNITGNDGTNAITWSVYGKIQSIYKTTGTISYTYDPSGQRVSKMANGLTTYYIRDAQGNTLAIYDNAHSNLNWKEQQLYGSSRLGLWTPNENLSSNNATAIWDTTGSKQYELTNHLGNVLETITDKRLQHTTDNSNIDYYLADVSTAQDYYPFGMLMPGRQYSFFNVYRYGFNGKENDNEVKGVGDEIDYGNRIYDPRVGRFPSIDLLQHQYAGLTPYQFASNSPIADIDLDGLEKYYYLFDVNKKNGITSLKTVVQTNESSGWDSFKGIFHLPSGDPAEEYERLKDFSGDVIKGIKRTFVLITPYGYTVPFGSEKALRAFDYSTYDKKTLDLHAMYIQTGILATPAELPSGLNSVETTTEGELLIEGKLIQQSNDEIANVRPTPYQSEKDLVPADAAPQVAFKNGKPVSSRTVGSVRPDGYNTSEAISTEIKNYNVSTQQGRTSLVNNVVKQVRQRLSNLPRGSTQNIIIDTRGQEVNQSILNNIKNRITTQAGSQNVNVMFKTN
ncbi:RHS repeat-associated core domain-containing protein [Mucilaginibacter mallensis]|uniref:RHS repeat-associated core domain-containing protein n=1 Tax=Mucilaginibacter mallensis TaxID=652787 RepID=A0A1H1MQU8_MUCMA|nr:RHS repeat-associated core domain-containing protein [Mucilaginibacter mallensis]SDR89174.1 RHS repeat-associated core domain-containing protein [Mucilaginibacter mallensis]